MGTYLIMGKFTEKGITNIKQTTGRSDKFKEIAAKFGDKVLQIYWLIGDYDVVNIVEAPDDQALQALLVRVGAEMFAPPPFGRLIKRKWMLLLPGWTIRSDPSPPPMTIFKNSEQL